MLVKSWGLEHLILDRPWRRSFRNAIRRSGEMARVCRGIDRAGEELNMATHMMRTLLNTMAFLAVLTVLGLWAVL